ncbi:MULTISPECIES: HTH-type transcriptional regulator ArgP [unclassified Paraburkholderia]|uniref:HTH-type transcriptional regulator ArgP n=1 Tax=unclassified Paraburkholderia TaxID=2615204 RepID=UPI00160EA5D9|nr:MULTISPECIES: HTH-type transcriptional regulator ArgP [unclassified Paraburkholderia]MBB5448273.1 LysR family transcriptional regulator (chromosome initiation inhibitor) [Paraburkholderia sp. WSM4177]MBB5488654.1 LysR family transcriptional regulator (chromosome initiation inhibitor) [Paraburkholderia sp. WSM4180]
MNFDRQQLETFFAVVEFRHFGQAARALNITRGAVSQRIIALEESFGTPLLVRDGVTPTPAGEALLRHIHMLRSLEADTIQQIKPGAHARAKTAIAVNADSLATWFGPAACAIAKESFALELIVDDQDHTLPVLARGEAIGCVSTASTAPTGFVAEPIGAMEYECVAAPEFSAACFTHGLNMHDILAAPAVLFNRKDGLHAAFLERLLGFPVSGYATHYFPSPMALLTAIRAGVGYGLVPSMQAQALIDSGDLVALAPRNRIAVDLYWHHWEVAPPNATAISETVMREARRALIQPAPASSGKGDEGEVAD